MRLAVLFPALLWALPAAGDSGEQVYQRVCSACHGTKFDKAPQLGDREAWAPRIKAGQAVLTAHAFVGVRNMPPRGGDASLELEDFARAVAYMARSAGGDWKDPDKRLLAKIAAEVRSHSHDAHK